MAPCTLPLRAALSRPGVLIQGSFRQALTISRPRGLQLEVADSLPLKLVQVNPCTLRQGWKRIAYLKKFKAAKVHIIGGQEFRRKHDDIFSEAGYTIAQTASDNGHGGCFLMISDTLPFAPDVDGCVMPTPISRDHVNLLHGTPRILIARVVAPRCQLLCCVFHGLDEDHGSDAVCAYWDDAFNIFRNVGGPVSVWSRLWMETVVSRVAKAPMMLLSDPCWILCTGRTSSRLLSRIVVGGRTLRSHLRFLRMLKMAFRLVPSTSRAVSRYVATIYWWARVLWWLSNRCLLGTLS